MEEEDPSWPLDADVGWGIRASEYLDKHSIKNVTVERVEIDEGWVKEINCLEWESFAFHPSPLASWSSSATTGLLTVGNSSKNWKRLLRCTGMLKIAYLLGL